MVAQAPKPGDVLGAKYRILRLIGDGGMGSVFEAENTFTDKRVAIKWIRALERRPTSRDRLMREARATSRIKHRNVIDIYDVGFEGEAMFLVMELLEGETLANFLETRTATIPAFLSLLLPAMRGVAAAHRQGVLHRDIKPDNIFLAYEEDEPLPTAVVLDFGIAFLEGEQMLTRSGHAVGTPLFMSLEQLRGVRDLDARADVYGFAVILYMALTGRAPHLASSLPELALSVASAEPTPAHVVRPELPPELSAVLGRALARERAHRTPSLDQLIQELIPFASELGYRALAGELASTLPMSGGRSPELTTEASDEASARPRRFDSLSRASDGERSAPLGRARTATVSSTRARRLYALLGLMVVSALGAAVWLSPWSRAPSHTAVPPQLPSLPAAAAAPPEPRLPTVSPLAAPLAPSAAPEVPDKVEAPSPDESASKQTRRRELKRTQRVKKERRPAEPEQSSDPRPPAPVQDTPSRPRHPLSRDEFFGPAP